MRTTKEVQSDIDDLLKEVAVAQEIKKDATRASELKRAESKLKRIFKQNIAV